MLLHGFQKEGLNQYEPNQLLCEFINSKDGMFLRDRYSILDKDMIKQNGIHGMKHSNRVATLSLIIAQNEGIIKEDSDREREILTFASYYHDIGRILDIGPHSKRGAKLANKIEFRDLHGKPLNKKDVNIIKMLIEGHEGNDKNIDKLLKKYNIDNQEQEMAVNLLKVLKDADALDRSRLTINTPIGTVTDLEPKFLRFNTSKKLMDFSYALESITSEIIDYDEILDYKNTNKGKHYYSKKEEFNNNVKVNEEIMERNARNIENKSKFRNDLKIDRTNSEEREM